MAEEFLFEVPIGRIFLGVFERRHLRGEIVPVIRKRIAPPSKKIRAFTAHRKNFAI
jgi:hypothetical protein